jgi:hypothetical protein
MMLDGKGNGGKGSRLKVKNILHRYSLHLLYTSKVDNPLKFSVVK